MLAKSTQCERGTCPTWDSKSNENMFRQETTRRKKTFLRVCFLSNKFKEAFAGNEFQLAKRLH